MIDTSIAILQKSNFVLLTLFIPTLLFGQNELSREQVKGDYTIFKDLLTRGHPGLYEYTTQTEWDSLFSGFEQKEMGTVKNSTDLFKSLTYMADHAKDGHLNIYHPKMDTVPSLFPLWLVIIEGKLYTDTDDFGIPVGTEITSIDGIPSPKIIQSLLKYAPTDGHAITRKYRQIEKEFGILHYYEFGAQKSYTVVCRTPKGEIKTKDLAPQSFESIGDRYANRNSHFAAYHGYNNKTEYFKNRIAERWPYVNYVDSIDLAVLTVNSFGLDPQKFKSRLIELFKEIKKRRVSNLVVDIRQNAGGYRVNAVHLYSFLTDQPFEQRISGSAITDVLPQKENLVQSVSDYTDFFKMYFARAEKTDDRWVLTDDQLQAEMVPAKKPFKGKVYVLIGGNTFSAASAFALNAKNSVAMTLVGEETGGGYYFHIGQYPAIYELPNSGIKVRMSFVKVDKYVIDKSVAKGSGVLPDVEVSLSVQDLILGKDSQLDYVIKEISEN